MYYFFPGFVVVLLAAFCFRMGTIKPYFMYWTVFGQDFEELIQKIFIIIIYLKFKFGFIRERSSGNFAGNCSFGILAKIAIKPFWVFDLKQIGRR